MSLFATLWIAAQAALLGHLEETQGTDTRVKPFPRRIRSKGCMRRARFKAEASVQVAHYHCVSRVVDRNFVLGELEKETFVKLMRRYETYCGVRVLSFCIMTNHFHILLEVPKRPAPENLPTDHGLVERLRLAECSYGAETLAQQLAALRQASRVMEAEALRERFFAHMWDVSFFMRLLKQRFSQWFNTNHSRKGTLWEERFRSVLVEGGDALRTVSLYVDLRRRAQGTDTWVKPFLAHFIVRFFLQGRL